MYEAYFRILKICLLYLWDNNRVPVFGTLEEQKQETKPCSPHYIFQEAKDQETSRMSVVFIMVVCTVGICIFAIHLMLSKGQERITF